MRRYITLLFAILFFIGPFSLSGQSLYVSGDEMDPMDLKHAMTIQRKIEKPGMTAKDIYRSFLFPKHCRRSDMGIVGGIEMWNTVESSQQIVFDVEGGSVHYYYYIYAFDGYYIVSMENIFFQKNKMILLYGKDGILFRDKYTKREYQQAIRIVDFVKIKFDNICTMLEEKAFPVLLPSD